MAAILNYVHDPMCSWCYAFGPVWQELQARLPQGLEVRRLLGGLAPDSDAPMPPELREQLENTWRRIEQRVPGIRFNFDFWRRAAPRRSTYPACRAVLAARLQTAAVEEAMTAAIQRAYYREARNPSDAATLVALADELGLDAARFADDLDSEPVRTALQAEIDAARALGASSFPSLVLQLDGSRWPLPLDYLDAGAMLETLSLLLPG